MTDREPPDLRRLIRGALLDAAQPGPDPDRQARAVLDADRRAAELAAELAGITPTEMEHP